MKRIVPLFLMLVGCGLNQDPLANKPDVIRNGRVPYAKPEPLAPESSEALRIDAPDRVTFRESHQEKLDIKVRVLADEYENDVRIENLNVFPGATFDQVSGVFTWTPPQGYVFEGLYKDVDLRIRVYSKHKTNLDAKVYTNVKAVGIRIEKNMIAPVIKSVDNIPDGFFEGNRYYLTVKVEDFDAGVVQESYPRLLVLPTDSTVSLAPLVTINRVEPDFANHLYTFSVTVNCADTELTKGYSTGGFALKAVTRFGKESSLMKIEKKVVTVLNAPDSTWGFGDTVEIEQGKPFYFPFLIYDKTGETDFEILDLKITNEGPKISCNTSSRGTMPCNLTWNVPEGQSLGEGEVLLKIKSLSKWYNDVVPIETTITMRYRIIEKKMIPPPQQDPQTPVNPEPPPQQPTPPTEVSK